RPRAICGFEVHARNEAGPRRMSPIALGRRIPSISVVGRVAPPFLDRTILSNSACSLTRHPENLAYSPLPPLEQAKRSAEIRPRLQRNHPLLLPCCFRKERSRCSSLTSRGLPACCSNWAAATRWCWKKGGTCCVRQSSGGTVTRSIRRERPFLWPLHAPPMPSKLP